MLDVTKHSVVSLLISCHSSYFLISLDHWEKTTRNTKNCYKNSTRCPYILTYCSSLNPLLSYFSLHHTTETALVQVASDRCMVNPTVSLSPHFILPVCRVGQKWNFCYLKTFYLFNISQFFTYFTSRFLQSFLFSLSFMDTLWKLDDVWKLPNRCIKQSVILFLRSSFILFVYVYMCVREYVCVCVFYFSVCLNLFKGTPVSAFAVAWSSYFKTVFSLLSFPRWTYWVLRISKTTVCLTLAKQIKAILCYLSFRVSVSFVCPRAMSQLIYLKKNSQFNTSAHFFIPINDIIIPSTVQVKNLDVTFKYLLSFKIFNQYITMFY